MTKLIFFCHFFFSLSVFVCFFMFLSVYFSFCFYLSVSVWFCLILSISVQFLSISFRFCSFQSVSIFLLEMAGMAGNGWKWMKMFSHWVRHNQVSWSSLRSNTIYKTGVMLNICCLNICCTSAKPGSLAGMDSKALSLLEGATSVWGETPLSVD